MRLCKNGEQRDDAKCLKNIAREGPFIPQTQHLLGLFRSRADGHDVCSCMR